MNYKTKSTHIDPSRGKVQVTLKRLDVEKERQKWY
jgi:hypothetical protein